MMSTAPSLLKFVVLSLGNEFPFYCPGTISLFISQFSWFYNTARKFNLKLWYLLVFSWQGWRCSPAYEPCGAYSFIPPYPISGCYHFAVDHLGIFHAIPSNSSSEWCISSVASISYLWGLVCLVLAPRSVSKMVTSQSWDIPWQASFEVSCYATLGRNYLSSGRFQIFHFHLG